MPISHTPHKAPTASPENDVANLFSHFGAASHSANYRELVQQDAALDAATRWPLIAEIEGLASAAARAQGKLK